MNHNFCYSIKISFPFCENLNDIDIKKINIVYKQNLILHENYPQFGVINSSSMDGYGISDCNGKLFKEIMLLTAEFPEIVFRIYYSYFDFKCLTICDIKGNKLLNAKSYEDEKIIKDGFTIYVDYKSIKIDNDVTDFINGNKNHEKILERRYSKNILKELNNHFIIMPNKK
jgi:hypothetical protein